MSKEVIYKFYDLESLTQEELDGLARERNTLAEENKQLKEQLENDIDRYEDTISYQLGFDKGKEYLQQRIDKATKLIKENVYIDYYGVATFRSQKCVNELLETLEDKENENNR